MNRLTMAIVSIAALTLAAQPAPGQDASGFMASPGGIAVIGGPRRGEWKVEGGIVSIMRAGQEWTNIGPATVGNAIKGLTELYNNVSFAADPHVAAKPIGDVFNRDDDPMSDLTALRVASANAFNIKTGLNSLFMLVPNDLTFIAAPSPENPGMECFNVSGFLQSYLAGNHDETKRQELTDSAVSHLQETILAAITSCDPLIHQPRFQFYYDGGVLIVTGSRRSIEVASKIIRALPGRPAAAQTFVDNGEDPAVRDYRNAVKQMQMNELQPGAGLIQVPTPLPAPQSAPVADVPQTNN